MMPACDGQCRGSCCSQGEQPPQQPDVAAVFKPMLPDLFTAAYRTAACSQEAFTQLTGLLDLWSSRGIFNLATSATVRARMLDVVCLLSAMPMRPSRAGGVCSPRRLLR